MLRRTLTLSKQLFFELIFVLLLFGFIWFLLGYYTHYRYLFTGYQDWLFHAYRLKVLLKYGFVSWDHIWSNGINYWRAYQYIPHLITLIPIKLFGLSITSAMNFMVVFLFAYYVITTYIVLRLLAIKRLSIILALLLSLSTLTYWRVIGDFSLLFSFLILPVISFVWVKSITSKKISFLLPALAGFSWTIHPIMGYTACFLWGITVLAVGLQTHYKQILIGIITILITSAPFWVPYVTVSYSFTNPFFSSREFINQVVSNNYLGLGTIFFTTLCLAWGSILLLTKKIARWAKILLLFSSLYLLIIFAGTQGYLPNFILNLQIGRAVFLIIYLLTLVFAAIFDELFRSRSVFIKSIQMVILAVILTEAISTASSNAPAPVSTWNSPVATFFSNHILPTGTVFFRNVSEASYFAPPQIKYSTSYNEHLEPHPLGQRYKQIFGDDRYLTSVSHKQVQLINSYSRVLGVEYIFLSKHSSIIPELTASNSAQPSFNLINDESAGNDYAVLKATYPVSKAYWVPDNVAINQQLLVKPNLRAVTNQPWDENIQSLFELISQNKITPLTVEYPTIDALKLDLTNRPDHVNKLLIIESYDTNWHALAKQPIKITPTSTRFTLISLPKDFQAQTLTLKNYWPWWYWAVLISGNVIFLSIILTLLIKQIYNQRIINNHLLASKL
jgi:hypothetical protein